MFDFSNFLCQAKVYDARGKAWLNRRCGYTVNKGLAISRPQPGCHLPNSPWTGIIDPIPVSRRFGQQKSIAPVCGKLGPEFEY